MKTVLKYLGWGIIFIANFLLVLVSIWSLRNYKILTFEDKPQTTTPTVKAGNHITFQFNYCKYIDLPSMTTTSFVDGFVYDTPTIVTNLKTGCHNDTVQVYVPKAIPVGIYKVQKVFLYQPNPIRKINYRFETMTFEVIK